MHRTMHPRGRGFAVGPHDPRGRRPHHRHDAEGEAERGPRGERGSAGDHHHAGDHHRAGIRFQMRRGAVRDAILRVLADEPMHGYQVMQELSARTGGRWQPSAGSIYPTLQQLEDEGLISGTDQEGRRTFALTDTGRAAAAALPAVGPWSRRGRGDDLRGLARELGIAAIQVSRVGSPAALDEARDILTGARKALYRILADDQPAAAQPADANPADDDTTETQTAN